MKGGEEKLPPKIIVKNINKLNSKVLENLNNKRLDLITNIVFRILDKKFF